ncbi:Uncharacterised protein [Chlamydia trachomatis]|nr:Uncharacterised protein [Chlamydia trachomatis]
MSSAQGAGAEICASSPTVKLWSWCLLAVWCRGITPLIWASIFFINEVGSNEHTKKGLLCL